MLVSAKVLPARTLDPISRTVLLQHRLVLIQTYRFPATNIILRSHLDDVSLLSFLDAKIHFVVILAIDEDCARVLSIYISYYVAFWSGKCD